jgi:proline iminopeptidase
MKIDDGFVTMDDGIRLFVRTVGTGRQTVVIPNGFYLIDDFLYLADGRTLIVFDPRNRGRSDQVTDPERLKNGIHHDVDDLEGIRRHFGVSRINLLGHSYCGMTLMLYAMKFSDHVHRVVQMGPMAPDQKVQYPAHLTNNDQTLGETLAKIGELLKDRGRIDPVEFCHRFWSTLNVIYVVNPADAHKVKSERCDLPNERNQWKPWTEILLPSIHRLAFTTADFARVQAPVLTIHGTKDRSSPYGGARDWTMRLPNARLVTVQGAAHMPWIEDPETVFNAVETFLDGEWPEAAEKVTAIDVRLKPDTT